MPYDNQRAYDRLIFELSSPGRLAFSLPESDVPVEPALAKVPEAYRRREPAALPRQSEGTGGVPPPSDREHRSVQKSLDENFANGVRVEIMKHILKRKGMLGSQ